MIILSILNNVFSYKIRKCVIFTVSPWYSWAPGLPPANSGPAPQWDTTH